MNVYDQAHGLAQAIKASEEFKQYDAVKKQVDANEELSKMIKDFQAKQLELHGRNAGFRRHGSDTAVIRNYGKGSDCGTVYGNRDEIFADDEGCI